MKILKFSVRLWKMCGVYPPTANTKLDSFLSILSVVVLFGALLIFWISSVAYLVIVIEKDNIAMSLLFYPILQIFSNATVIGPYASTLLVRSQIRKTIESFQAVIDKRNKEQLLFEDVERRTNRLGKWLSGLFLCWVNGTKVVTMIGYGIRDVIRGHFDRSTYYDTLRIKMPFNSDSIIGYIAYSFVEIYIVIAYYVAFSSNLTLFINLCLYLEAMCKDFANVYQRIDRLAMQKRPNGLKLKRCLIEAIDFQANIYQLFQQMKSVVKGMLFILQLTSAGMIACAIFLVDGASQQFDTNFVIMVVVLIVSLVTIFPCCYFASRITAKLDQSAQIIYFSMWYLVPFNERKQFPFVIAFAQRDHSIRMMNMFSCSLESFVQILRASLSYYLMFKKL